MTSWGVVKLKILSTKMEREGNTVKLLRQGTEVQKSQARIPQEFQKVKLTGQRPRPEQINLKKTTPRLSSETTPPEAKFNSTAHSTDWKSQGNAHFCM